MKHSKKRYLVMASIFVGTTILAVGVGQLLKPESKDKHSVLVCTTPMGLLQVPAERVVGATSDTVSVDVPTTDGDKIITIAKLFCMTVSEK